MRRIVSAIIARIGRLPKPILYASAAAVVALLTVGGVLAYRTWDYIEHDNDFCMSCHLMQDPFERFSRSAHQGLGCKACHKPTFVARSRMALTQILENPEELEEHAVVPNEKCVACHVEGDPGKWTLISASVGHRVHLESDDPSLDGLRCVQCHSSGVHEFAATSQTCAQSGCHEDVTIRLGRMGDFAIHCVACHDFSRPVDEPARVAGADSARVSTVVAPLRPRASECLSCHAMRQLVGEIPEDEPHGGVCGACHDPHEQTRPADAVRSCAAAGCHDAVDAITPLHRGLDAGVVERCTLCHAAHDARIDRVDCAACHTDGARFARGDPATFDHARHRTVACTRCHASDRTHGALVTASVEDCRACHHRPQQGAAGVDCAACHSRDDIALEVHRVARVVELSVGRRSRALPFVHANHASVVCSTCHTEGLALSATTVDCASCHEQHHAPDATCRSCHVAAPPSTHPPRVVHTTCAGSGCHDAVPFRERPETREFCLACHQDQVAHEPQGRCVDCHAMPAWRASR